jgi:predicted transcriptional regulator
MAQMKNGKKALLGNLNNYLKETLNLILKKGKITASDLSEYLKLPANTSGTRLLNLHKKRVVRRIEEVIDGGRVWVYERI